MNTLGKLFVYGSLRNGFGHPAFEYISGNFALLGKGTAPAALYDMGQWPVAIPSLAGHRVVGELYELRENDIFSYIFAQLDEYEGVHPEEGLPLYKRQETTVTLEDGSTHKAWAYWFNGSVENGSIIESGDVLEYMRNKS